MPDVCDNTKSMAEWLKEESPSCHPCLMAPVVDWYLTELAEQGRDDLAAELREVVEKTGDTAEIGKVGEKMDAIKEVTEGELRDRLREFDCTVQSYAKETAGEKEVE